MQPAGSAVQITPAVRRILAPNPSALTGPGTNSYLVGTRDLALIDPGPDLAAHKAALLAAVLPGQRIRTILVTHAHRDHSALAPAMAQATGAEVLAFGDATSGRSARMRHLVAAGLPPGAEGVDHGFRPDRPLACGETVCGDGWTLEALHTPGHMGGHLCLALGDVLFSGDHVMGWASSLIAPPDGCMGDYMASLARLAQRAWSQFLPGHGDRITNPAHRLDDLATHRRAREAQVLAALAQGAATPQDLTRKLYHDTPPALHPAAARNVLAHLIDLEARNLVTATPAPHPDATFRLAVQD